MGLYIRVLSGLNKIETPTHEELEDKISDCEYISVKRDIIEIDQAYDIEEGVYSYDKDTEAGFNMGAYSTYNTFRNVLSLFSMKVMSNLVWMNSDKYQGSLFYEIVCHSDCDGYFGPDISKKLYKDFESNKYIFKEFCDSSVYIDASSYEIDLLNVLYSNLLEAFKKASVENGIVIFN